MCIITDGSEKHIPSNSKVLSDNGISIVFRALDGYIYKRSIPYLIQNELSFYNAMRNTGFVPSCILYDKYTQKHLYRIRNLKSMFLSCSKKGSIALVSFLVFSLFKLFKHF